MTDTNTTTVAAPVPAEPTPAVNNTIALTPEYARLFQVAMRRVMAPEYGLGKWNEAAYGTDYLPPADLERFYTEFCRQFHLRDRYFFSGNDGTGDGYCYPPPK